MSHPALPQVSCIVCGEIGPDADVALSDEQLWHGTRLCAHVIRLVIDLMLERRQWPMLRGPKAEHFIAAVRDVTAVQRAIGRDGIPATAICSLSSRRALDAAEANTRPL